MSGVLVVDLDQTLIRIDILAELAVQQLLSNPFSFSRKVVSSRSVLGLKKSIGEAIQFDAQSLPVNREVLDIVLQRRDEGWQIVLATASVGAVAEPIAQSLKIFDQVIWSEDENLKGAKKARRLESMFGVEGFDYIGDSNADLAVWKSARNRFYAGSSRAKFKELSQHVDGLQDLGIVRSRRTVPSALRTSHWIKNLLVFVPLLLLGDVEAITPERLLNLTLLFFSMSFAASSLYLVNDILDTWSDRSHPDKLQRSIASGQLLATHALVLSLLLLLFSGALAWLAGGPILLALVAAYAAGSYLYSSIVKRLPLLDIVFLTLLYLARIFIGSWLVSVPVSFWLAVFAFFAFLSLASIKRLSELKLIADFAPGAVSAMQSRRGYVSGDENLVLPLGIAFGVASQLVLALYIDATFGSDGSVVLAPMSILLLWTIWMLTMWLDFARGNIHSDPVKHALKSKRSLLLLALIMFAFVVSKSI